mmetsp:Transcript_15878/g.51959  ORF Transcript_15878/g.51959 Transcript_15878/m.51959 type:complete len:181 (+) Transcript_15878:1105-1647(+)
MIATPCPTAASSRPPPPARHHHCPPTPLRPRPHPRWQGFTRAQAQVQQQPVQQQQLVQQRVITLAHAMGGRHVLQDGSLWTRPIGRPPLPPGSKKAQRGAVQSVEAPSAQKELKEHRCCPKQMSHGRYDRESAAGQRNVKEKIHGMKRGGRGRSQRGGRGRKQRGGRGRRRRDGQAEARG